MRRHWTKEENENELRRVAKKLGHTPTTDEFSKYGSLNTSPVINRFGSWNKALIAAGLKLNHEMSISKARCLTELCRIEKELGRAPTCKEFKETTVAASTVIRRFGSWNKALVAAGLKPTKVSHVSKTRCIAELQRLAKKLGRTPTYKEFTEHVHNRSVINRFGSRSVINRFGSWNKALVAAGLEPTKTSHVSKIQCITELQRVAKLGCALTNKEFTKHASLCSATIASRFGSWNKGLVAAGLDVIRFNDIPEAQIVAELQRVAKKLGRTPTQTELTEHASFCSNTVINRFGSWNKALAAAGLIRHSTSTECSEKAYRILKDIPDAMANILPEVLLKALFDLLGRSAPSLIPEAAARAASIRVARLRRPSLGAARDALKKIEETLSLSKGQENKIVLEGVMNCIDRMHTNQDTTFRRAVLLSECNFAEIMARQFRREMRRAREIQRSVPCMRYEQALLTVKIERPQGWWYS
jgi:hypothetical protein